MQMSNYYAPCFYRIDFVVIPSYIKLPCSYYFEQPDYSGVACHSSTFRLLRASGFYYSWILNWTLVNNQT